MAGGFDFVQGTGDLAGGAVKVDAHCYRLLR
jgi:hypothetical protein